MTQHAAPLTLIDHLTELRKRLTYSCVALLIAFVLTYPFSQTLFAFLVKPLALLSHKRLIYTGLAEAFLTYLKVSFLGAFFLASPIILAQIWLFVSPGLYRQERRVFLFFLIMAPCLCLLGASLAYYVVCPLAWKFFLAFETYASHPGQIAIELEARVSEYLSLMMKLIFAFAFSFQLPLILLGCAEMKLLHSAPLKKHRKYAFLGIVIVAALLTPPDILSPLSLILPIYALYELSIVMISWREREK